MSPTISGNANAAVHDHRHRPLTVRRSPGEDVDPWQRLAAAKERSGTHSPIKPPPGGWAGPEPTLLDDPRPEPTGPSPTSQPGPGITDDALRTLQRMAESGATMRQAAEAADLPRQFVRRIALAHGLRFARPTPTGKTAEWDVEEGARLAGKGLSAGQIADELGVSAATVRRAMGRRGVQLIDQRRRPGRAAA